MTGTARVIRGNAIALPLPDDSVDLVVTSPPYFGLRSYQDGGEHYDGQIGDEATPGEFVDALIAATREMVRVVKPTGSIWVNLGDKYAGSDGGGGYSERSTLAGFTNANTKGRQMNSHARARLAVDTPAKSLIGVPWRYALRCIDDLGLILRAEVIWSKPNGLPESVTDRVRRSHETWFHFTLRPRYFSAVDEVREPAERGRPQAARALALAAAHGIGEEHRAALLARGLGDQGRSAATQSGTGKNTERVQALAAEADRVLGSYTREFTMTSQTLGKLPGSVWTVPTQPLRVPDHLGVDHFAAFPMEWPRRIIRGWSPSGVCTACGEGRRPVVATNPMKWKPSPRLEAMRCENPTGLRPTSGTMLLAARHTITGYACACPDTTAPTTRAVVLDPFGGTGTTALVARALGRTGISVDMSADYCRLAEWRVNDPAQIAAAMQVEKPPVEVPDQLAFEVTP